MAKTKVKPNWADPATTAENEILPRYFKWAWTSRGVSLAINVILVGYLTYYCTDMLGMKAALVGTLLLASKVFDGVTDLIVGFIIDKTNTKFGKARPYEICIILVWLLTILMYSTPNLGTVGKSVFIFILYTLINSVCATFLNGGDAVYLAHSVRSEANRVSVMSFNGGIIMIFSMVLGMILPQMIAGIGSTKAGWTVIAASIGIPFAIIGILRFIFVKEVVQTESNKANRTVRTVPFKTALSCVVKNKYMWILSGMTFVVGMTSGVSAVNTYYFKYIMGNIGLASLISMSNLVTPIVMLIFPALSRKFGTVTLLKAGAALGVIGYGIRIIGGKNLVTLIAGSVIGTVAVLPIGLMTNIYMIDVMDYGEWKTGIRVEGMLGSIKSFSSKLSNGLASGMVGFIMGLTGYDGNLAVQSVSANVSIIALFNYVPLVLMIVLLLLAIIYKLDKELPTIKAELEAKHRGN